MVKPYIYGYKTVSIPQIIKLVIYITKSTDDNCTRGAILILSQRPGLAHQQSDLAMPGR